MISLNKNGIGVFILAYKRLGHLKRTIYRLKKYIHKSDVIYIFMDKFSEDQSLNEINAKPCFGNEFEEAIWLFGNAIPKSLSNPIFDTEASKAKTSPQATATPCCISPPLS